VNRRFPQFLLAVLLLILTATITRTQDDPAPSPAQENQGRMRGGQEGGRPLFGKITAVRDGAIDIAGQDGQTVTVTLTSQTEFRKDRQPAKVSDFKVGDMVMVRGAENADHTITAKLIGSRTGGGPMGGGPNGGRGGMMMAGTLGKDYVAGEVKSIDAPKLTVLRTDNVTQTLELNEDTSLRRGRDSITMADIKVGDHVMARGALQNDVFVPKGVNVISPEQWQRMQQMMSQQDGSTKPGASQFPAPKPQE
jgi:hypothetical protein